MSSLSARHRRGRTAALVVAALAVVCGCRQAADVPEPVVQDESAPVVRIALRADAEGQLTRITLDGRELEADEETALEAIGRELSAQSRGEGEDEWRPEAEFEFDEPLRYRHLRAALNACRNSVSGLRLVGPDRTFDLRGIDGWSPQGDISPSEDAEQDLAQIEVILPDIQVRLKAAEDGSLASLHLGRKPLGSDASAFENLNSEILKIIGRPGNPLTTDIRVVIEAPDELQSGYILQTVGACAGRFDPATGEWVTFIEYIWLEEIPPPREPVLPFDEQADRLYYLRAYRTPERWLAGTGYGLLGVRYWVLSTPYALPAPPSITLYTAIMSEQSR